MPEREYPSIPHLYHSDTVLGQQPISGLIDTRAGR